MESFTFWIWVAKLCMMHILEKVIAIKATCFMSFASIYNRTYCMEPYSPSSTVLHLCAFLAIHPILLCCAFKCLIIEIAGIYWISRINLSKISFSSKKACTLHCCNSQWFPSDLLIFNSSLSDGCLTCDSDDRIYIILRLLRLLAVFLSRSDQTKQHCWKSNYAL